MEIGIAGVVAAGAGRAAMSRELPPFKTFIASSIKDAPMEDILLNKYLLFLTCSVSKPTPSL